MAYGEGYIYSSLNAKKFPTLCPATLRDRTICFRESIPVHDWTGPWGFSSLSFTGFL